VKLTLRRFSSGESSTLGLLEQDGRFVCFTLEDPHREVKIPGDTRIPAGIYLLTLQLVGHLHATYSTRFEGMHRGMLALMAVPNFSGVMLHCGNTDADTDGCILVGDSAIQNVSQRGALATSEAAYKRVYPPIAAALGANDLVSILITDEG
jgi:hypothetical protein